MVRHIKLRRAVLQFLEHRGSESEGDNLKALRLEALRSIIDEA
jgi:hypothetical protein